uniref:hypothetical protein n=1 Tax=Candidatus Fimivicinus sp. TaxID=3056640 RepID=UPI003FEF060B
NGFELLQENAAREENHLYIALCAQYTGAKTACSPGMPYIGRLSDCRTEAALLFLQKQRQRLAARTHALRRSEQEPEECARLEAAAAELDEAMKGMEAALPLQKEDY